MSDPPILLDGGAAAWFTNLLDSGAAALVYRGQSRDDMPARQTSRPVLQCPRISQSQTLRHSFDRAAAKAAIHMVSAWANRHRLVLGQVTVDDKSNAITAMPQLLNMVDFTGATVTMDAMECQKEIAKVITEQGAD
jgi:hypothetical protein